MSSETSKTAVPLADFLNNYFRNTEPSKIVLNTAIACAGIQLVREIINAGPVIFNTKNKVMSFVRRNILASYLKSEIKKNVATIKFPSADEKNPVPNFESMPQEGLSEERVLEISRLQHEVLDEKMSDIHLSGAVYHGAESSSDMFVRIFEQHLWSNALFADFFGATRKMEGEVIEMGVRLFNGNPDKGNCAAFTSGGSESIMMAMMAYRNQAREERGISNPNVVLCETAHPAFDKASEYFGIRLVKVPPNPTTFQLDPADVEKYLTEETVAIVGSAPQYAHGIVDPIAALAALAQSRNIGMHVDACVGGFFIQFLDPAVQPIIDFRVPGVTTISADIHKWGATPKGASLVLYRDRSLRSHQMFAYASFPGGLYASMSANGSKGGYTAAFAWAAMLRFGKNGYHNFSERTRLAAMKLKKEVTENVEGLELFGDPNLSIISLRSEYFDIYLLSQRMKKHGWVFINLQFPPGIHLGMTLDHAAPGAIERFIKNLKEEVASLMPEKDAKSGKYPKGKISYAATIYGSSQTIPDRQAVEMMLKEYIAKTVEPVEKKEEA